MRKLLKIASMLTATAIATSFSPHPARLYAAESDKSAAGITTTEENGRKIYVNDSAPAPRPTLQPKRPELMYWSSKENRWKPVSSANSASMQAARSWPRTEYI